MVLAARMLVSMETALHIDECMADSLTGDERAAAMARKYVWWQPPERTLEDRRLFLAQMMTLGTVADIRWLLSRVQVSELCRILRDPPTGIFNRRSWNFRHLRLGLTPTPKLPTRRPPREMPR